jgi:hypothetical protein
MAGIRIYKLSRRLWCTFCICSIVNSLVFVKNMFILQKNYKPLISWEFYFTKKTLFIFLYFIRIIRNSCGFDGKNIQYRFFIIKVNKHNLVDKMALTSKVHIYTRGLNCWEFMQLEQGKKNHWQPSLFWTFTPMAFRGAVHAARGASAHSDNQERRAGESADYIWPKPIPRNQTI